MSEYANREREYYNSLPGMVSQQIEAQTLAAAKGDMKYAEYCQAVAKLPSLTIQEKMDIIYSDQPMNFGITIPGMGTVNLKPYGAIESDIEFSMTVHASTNTDDSSDASGTVEASGGVKMGPLFHGSFKSSGSFSKHSATKRESDYTAVVDVKVHMGRLEVPETLQKVMDMMGEVTKAGTQVNLALVAQQAKIAMDQSAAADKSQPPKQLDPPADDKGGDDSQ